MTSRERVIRAIEFGAPDKIPIYHYVMPGAYWRHGQKLVDLLNSIRNDFGGAPFVAPPEPEQDVVEYTDKWGTVWQWFKWVGHSMGEVKEPALPTWDNWPQFEFPAVSSFDDLKQHIKATDHEYYTFGCGASLFEEMQWIRAPANVYLDLAENNDEINELADRLVDYSIEGATRSVQAGADGCLCWDDWGAQQAMLISPQLWREFFKPRYKLIFDAIKNAGGHVWFHTDGYIVDILDDFIEIGVDVLNPQHHVMGEALVAEHIAGKVCLLADLDCQRILPHGTPEEVQQHTQETIALFGNYNGGLVLHGEIEPDMPFENIEVMYEAFEKYGTYPLDWIE